MLRTERCTLRRWREADKEPFAEMNADARVMEFFPSVLGREESDAFADRIEQGFAENGFGLWALEVEDRFAGFVGLNRTLFDTPMGPHIEIGWRLMTWAWGRGLATEAAREVLADGFGRLGLGDVYSFTTERNMRSRAVMERSGMMRREEFDFDHPRTPEWWGRRHVVYHLSMDAWSSRTTPTTQ
jgi:ribosomal-protein-alanine N-acetyltransferase